MIQRYRVLQGNQFCKTGDIVYNCIKYDNKDNQVAFMTYDRDGDYPFFSINKKDLELITEEIIDLPEEMVKRAAEAVQIIHRHDVEIYGLKGAMSIVPNNYRYIKAALEAGLKYQREHNGE